MIIITMMAIRMMMPITTPAIRPALTDLSVLASSVGSSVNDGGGGTVSLEDSTSDVVMVSISVGVSV